MGAADQEGLETLPQHPTAAQTSEAWHLLCSGAELWLYQHARGNEVFDGQWALLRHPDVPAQEAVFLPALNESQ